MLHEGVLSNFLSGTQAALRKHREVHALSMVIAACGLRHDIAHTHAGMPEHLD